MSVPDIVLLPHCDLHMALHGTPDLVLHVMRRTVDAVDPLHYNLEDVTSSCAFDFFAPYNAVGHRLDNLPAVNSATGRVTANTPGVYLFQVRRDSFYIVGRLQVHDTIQRWWFGNSSITTALDPTFAHAQPSIYAKFSNDPSGTDPVGDITGHGYVTLTSNDPAVFVVGANGRLRGVAEGNGTVSGAFLGITHNLPVAVIDYGRARNELDSIRVPNIGDPSSMHNIVFVAEGFRDSTDDRKLFDKVVTKVVDEMFSKPRHQPYPLLQGSFNIWKAYSPSKQHTMTCGFLVNDQDAGNVSNGSPIPYDYRVSGGNTYEINVLIRSVGLPLSNESRDRAALVALWNSQSLPNFDPARVDDKVVAAWKGQKSAGILEARDTFLGFHLGARPGDRTSGFSDPPVAQPGADNADAALRAFVARVYEFFQFKASRQLVPDPRRHPPELFAGRSEANPGYSILRYLSSLCWRFDPHPNIGQQWQPDPHGVAFKRSRGLVAVIANDGLDGGSNVCDNTMTAQTLAEFKRLAFEFVPFDGDTVMRRKPPASISEEVDSIIDTVAHEFGHSFNLADEYEELDGNDPSADVNVDIGADNVTWLGWIFENGVVAGGHVTFANDQIDPDKVKWFDLLRMRASDVLIKDSETEAGQIKVTIDKRYIAAWVSAKAKNLEAYLRAPDITANSRQLPLQVGDQHYLVRLVIGNIDEAQGTILLGGPELPPAPFPVFPKGSLLFVPLRTKSGDLVFVVEPKVLEKLKQTHTPLNKDTDAVHVNREEDVPVDIDGFKPPCKAYKVIGVYQGADHYAGRDYRPSGLCKMRKSGDEGTGDGEFCHVCKWLIVNRVNPGLHAILDKKYYPNARKGGNE